jgi:hypothetical protein
MSGLEQRMKTLNAVLPVNMVLKPCLCQDADVTRGWNLLKNRFSPA